MANTSALESWLDRRINHERTAAAGGWGLDRMRRLLTLLGQPQRGLPVVHVAGTKGKGSTVAMLAAILTASGHRVGRYMSPHVHGLEERIAVNGRLITHKQLLEVWLPVRKAVEKMDAEAAQQGRRGPTWFEVMTAMAFLHFRQQQVKLAILEAGLGGRLDATNVCEPVLTVITSISMDHMRELGNSIASIAREKAGIIKRGRPLLCGVRHRVARRVIRDVAVARRSPLVMIDRDFLVEPSAVRGASEDQQRYQTEVVPMAHRRIALPVESRGREACRVRMRGRHQAENAGLAVAAASLLHARGYQISWPRLQRALNAVQLPARIEQLGNEPRLIVDAAHNAASMISLCRTLPSHVSDGGRRVLVFAASADKQLREMLEATRDWAQQLVLTRSAASLRSASLTVLLSAAEQAVPHLAATCVIEEDPLAAVQKAKRLAAKGGIVCVAGSFFLAAEVRKILLRKTRQGD
jgi:dihydrofolate synthase/folylpolyglutamate synthase